MSTQARTEAVSPHELARKGGQFTGRIPFAAFERLDSLASGTVVDVVLRFGQDDRGRSRVFGRAAAAVTMDCQRCLEPVPRDVVVDIDFRIVASEVEASESADEFEAFVWDGDQLSVVELIEDDLILALPMRVCEAYDACPNRPALRYPNAAEDGAGAPASGAFAALAEWQNRRN